MGNGIVIGLEKVLGKLEKLPVDIQNDVDRVLAEGANDVVNLSRTLTPVDEGKLRNGTTAARLGKAAYEVTNNVFYGPYVEFGTGKKVQIPAGYESVAAEAKSQAKRGNYNEFVENLAQWIKRKGLAGTYSTKTKRRTGSKDRRTREDLQLARFLAYKILKNGIEAQPFFFKAWEAMKPKILNEVENAVTKKR